MTLLHSPSLGHAMVISLNGCKRQKKLGLPHWLLNLINGLWYSHLERALRTGLNPGMETSISTSHLLYLMTWDGLSVTVVRLMKMWKLSPLLCANLLMFGSNFQLNCYGLTEENILLTVRYSSIGKEMKRMFCLSRDII